MAVSKNSRTGRAKVEQSKDCLPKYNGGNVGATWKTSQCKGGSAKLSFEIKHKKRFGTGGGY